MATPLRRPTEAKRFVDLVHQATEPDVLLLAVLIRPQAFGLPALPHLTVVVKEGPTGLEHRLLSAEHQSDDLLPTGVELEDLWRVKEAEPVAVVAGQLPLTELAAKGANQLLGVAGVEGGTVCRLNQTGP